VRTGGGGGIAEDKEDDDAGKDDDELPSTPQALLGVGADNAARARMISGRKRAGESDSSEWIESAACR
jgi:hypothetical protein